MSIHHFGAETQGFQGQVDQNEGVLMPFGKSPEKFPFCYRTSVQSLATLVSDSLTN